MSDRDLTVRELVGDERRDLMAMACAFHARAEDPKAYLWRYLGYPGGGVRAFGGFTASGRLEAGCALLPRRLYRPADSVRPATLFADVGRGFGDVAEQALAAVMAVAERECFAAGSACAVLLGGPAPASFGQPDFELIEGRLDAVGLWSRLGGAVRRTRLHETSAADVDLEPEASACLLRDAEWLRWRYLDRPRRRARLFRSEALAGGEQSFVAVERNDDKARLLAGPYEADALLGAAEALRRELPAMTELRLAVPSWHPVAKRLEDRGAPVPVWVRWQDPNQRTDSFHVDFDEMAVECALV
jgi:hypothetical protein